MADRVRFYRGRPLTPGEIAEALERTCDTMEDTLDELRTAALRAAEAESNYRAVHARAVLLSGHKQVAMKHIDADDQEHVRAAKREKEIAVALRDVTRDAIRVRQTESEALRTLSVGLRAAETGRG